MSSNNLKYTKAIQILAINLHIKFLQTRNKEYLDQAIQNGCILITAESSSLLYFAAMHYNYYKITKNLDNLEEVISVVTMAISKAAETALEFLYMNIRGYHLQKHNHTRHIKDLRAVFCTSVAAAANSLKWRTHRGISDGDWHCKIHNITFLVPIFLRHGIVLPALQSSTRGMKV